MTESSQSESASKTLRRVNGDCCEETSLLTERKPDDSIVEEQLSVFKALSNSHRLRIVEALREGELCACELQTILDAPQSTVSSHLSELRNAGIVRTRQEGKWTYYRIADTASIQLLDLAAVLGKEK